MNKQYTQAEYSKYVDKKYFTMTGNLACQPCGQRKCPDKDNPNACANLPKPDEVINKALEILF